MTTAVASEVVARLETGERYALAETPVTLLGGPVDLYLASPVSQRDRFVTTLAEGALLPPRIGGFGLSIVARRESTLVLGATPAGGKLWLEALQRAARSEPAIAPPQSADDYVRHTVALLAAIARRIEADEGRDEAATDTALTRQDDAFQGTLGAFGRLLRGRFHREPAGIRTPLAAAAASLVEFHHLKVLTVPDRSDERREDFLERFAAAHGLRLRRIGLDVSGGLPDGEGAMLVFDADGRPLVVKPRTWGGVTIEDPEGQEPPRRLRQEEWRTFAPDAFAFLRTLPDGKLTYWTIFQFGLAGSAWDFTLLAVCGLFGAVLALLPPIASAQISSVAAHTADLSFLAELLAVLGACLVAETVFFIVGKLAELRAQGRSAIALHAAMADRLLRLPSQARRASTTLILATQTETVEKFRRAALASATAAALALANGLAAAALVAFMSPPAGLMAIGLVILLVGFAAFLGWAQFKAIYDGERMDVIVLAFVYDVIRLVPMARAMHLEKRVFTQWSENFLAFQSRLMRSARISNRLEIVVPAWDALALALCFAAVAYLGSMAELGPGQAIVLVMALGRLTRSGRELAQAVLGFSKLMPMAKLARPLIEHQVEPLAAGPPPPPLAGRIDVVGVNFFYGSRRALADIDLSVSPGEFIGIIGPSGSGKSSLLNLLAGLERPQSGRLMFDGNDLAGLDRRHVARQIGFVTHGSRLFPGSIYENIRGASSITADEAWRHAEEAGIADALRGLPMGLATIITEAGSGLATSEVQRILIARALAQKPAILILDEAMSTLDKDTQRRVLDTLSGLKLTRIVSTHHPSALEKADRVVVLDRGAVVDIGKPGEIMGRHGFFVA